MVSMEFFVHALPFKEITILRVHKTRCVQEEHIFRQRCDPPPALPHFQSQKRGISLDRSILCLRSFSPTVNSSRPTLMLVRVQRTLKIVQNGAKPKKNPTISRQRTVRLTRPSIKKRSHAAR